MKNHGTPVKRTGEQTNMGGVALRCVAPAALQFSHYVIFFIAIFTVLQLVVLGASTYPIKRRWDSAAYKSKEEVREDGRRAMAQQLVGSGDGGGRCYRGL